VHVYKVHCFVNAQEAQI